MTHNLWIIKHDSSSSKNMKTFYGNNGMDWMQDWTGNIKSLFWRLIIMYFVLYNLKLNIWTIVYKWWAVKIPYLYTACHIPYVKRILTTLMTVLLTLVELGLNSRPMINWIMAKMVYGCPTVRTTVKVKWVLFLVSSSSCEV